jgi:hypothetical protein
MVGRVLKNLAVRINFASLFRFSPCLKVLQMENLDIELLSLALRQGSLEQVGIGKQPFFDMTCFLLLKQQGLTKYGLVDLFIISFYFPTKKNMILMNLVLLLNLQNNERALEL